MVFVSIDILKLVLLCRVKLGSETGCSIQCIHAAIEDWSNCQEIFTFSDENEFFICEAENLQPGTAYKFRLSSSEAMGKEFVFDTMPVSCAPEGSGVCLIL